MLGHKRARRLGTSLHQVLNLIPERTGLRTAAVLGLDRPTRHVRDAVAFYQDRPNLLVTELDCPVMSAGGQRWTEARNILMDRFDTEDGRAPWCANFDDDWVLGPGWDDPRTGLLAAVRHQHVVSWRAVSLFIWDRGEGPLVNTMQHHDSPWLGRYETGWRRDEAMTNQITPHVERMVAAEPTREKYLPFYILDCGTITPNERRRLYNEYMAAGKQCRYVRNYVRPPKLRPLKTILKRYKKPETYSRHQLNMIG
jgi:hypothetical protein